MLVVDSRRACSNRVVQIQVFSRFFERNSTANVSSKNVCLKYLPRKMETKNYRRVTLRSSIKINFKPLDEAPTLSFKLKRNNAKAAGFRRASELEQSEQIRKLRSTKFSFAPRFRSVYSKFPTTHRYVTGTVRDYFVSNK